MRGSSAKASFRRARLPPLDGSLILRPMTHPSLPRTAFRSPLKRACRRLAVLSLSGFLLLPAVRAGEPADRQCGRLLAAEPRTDKSQYNLFNPTPDDLLRDFQQQPPGPDHRPALGRCRTLLPGNRHGVLAGPRGDAHGYLELLPIHSRSRRVDQRHRVGADLERHRQHPHPKLGSGNARSDSTITGAPT